MAKERVVVRTGFRFRKLADKGRGRLVDGNGNPLGPWPTLGWTFTEPPPEYAVVPEKVLLEMYREKLPDGRNVVELTNEQQVVRPAGPAHAPWAGKANTPGVNHFFVHADQVTFHFVEGDYVYDVAENPDKQHVNVVPQGTDETGGGDVSHDYLLNLASAPEGYETPPQPELSSDVVTATTRLV